MVLACNFELLWLLNWFISHLMIIYKILKVLTTKDQASLTFIKKVSNSNSPLES